ncbi:phosphopantetheine-binding protein [Paenibacillus xylaniclasticus]|uniref:phosphopantetheine-binding protein n=1 Tax=Paenibacillus xylaniclasticus TaxID=588083 RepID=UPI000FDC397C|nr:MULTISPECIES: phosphopantetheine-binding protein [Paenibacillus]GFN30891.1 hypothetical protein PCURB6_11510 [Paenibacillus curdlanolyticus]
MRLDEAQVMIINEIKSILELNEDIEVDEELQSIGLDSGNSIRLMVSIEEWFDFEFSDEDLADDSILYSVQSICSFLMNKGLLSDSED